MNTQAEYSGGYKGVTGVKSKNKEKIVSCELCAYQGQIYVSIGCAKDVRANVLIVE